jgi:hypothetical protein
VRAADPPGLDSAGSARYHPRGDVRAIATSLLALFAGCVDEYQGSNVQFDFSPGMPVLASPGATPRAGELPANTHFTLYAFQADDTTGRLFEIERFEIHRIVDPTSPCFIDVGDHVPHPGLHVTQFAKVIGEDTGITDLANPPPNATEQQKIDAATAVQREENIAALASDQGIKVVTSASISNYPALAADCTDTSGIPPPDCTDAVSNKRRLDMCQQAWGMDPSYYEGTDRILTSPLAGVAHGMVDGINPINLAPVGGAQIFVDEVLDGFDGFAIYTQPDDQVTPGGDLFLYGTPTMPTRGVIHVHMTSAVAPGVTADLAIFSNLGEDDVSF